jgi:hypothetical protein
MFNRVRRRRRARYNRARRYRHNPRRFFMHNRRYRHNPRRRYRHNRARRHRRNPSSARHLMPMIVAGTLGAVVTNMVARFIGAGGLMGYGVRLAVAVGGGYAADKMAGRSASDGWIIGSIAPLVYDIFRALTGGTFTYSAFPDMQEGPMLGPGQYTMTGAAPSGVEYQSYGDLGYTQADAY